MGFITGIAGKRALLDTTYRKSQMIDNLRNLDLSEPYPRTRLGSMSRWAKEMPRLALPTTFIQSLVTDRDRGP